MTTTISECRHCGKSHGLRCPEVKALEYFESGELKRVEFMTPGDYLASVMAAPLSPYSSKPTCDGEWLPNPFPAGALHGAVDAHRNDSQTIYGAPKIGVSGK